MGRANDQSRLVIWIALSAGVLLLLPHVFTSGSNIALMNQMGIAIIFALSYNILLGAGGMLSFGHAVYLGVPAFFSMHLMQKIGTSGWWFPVALLPLAGAITGAIFGAIFGYLASRRWRVAFAMITLGIGELVAASLLMLTFFSGGEQGITADRTMGPDLFGITLASRYEVYFVIAAWLLLSAAAMFAFTRTPLGQMLNAVRDNPQRVQFLGYDPRFVRFMSFTISSAFAGIAGSLTAINYEIITFETVSLQASGLVLIMTYIGGIYSFYGPIIGAVIITWMQMSLSDYTEAWLLYLGLMFILVVMFAPNGLAGIVADTLRAIRRAGITNWMTALLPSAMATAVVVLGGIVIVETSFHLSVGLGDLNRMRLFGVTYNPRGPWAWIIGGVLLLAGVFLLRLGLRGYWRRMNPEREVYQMPPPRGA